MRRMFAKGTLRPPVWVISLIALLSGPACVGPAVDPLVPPRTAPVVEARVVAVYPHDPEAFTQGLVFYNGQLYESTGLRGESTLRRVDLATGQVLQRVDLAPRYFAEGLAALNGRLYQITWQEETGFAYDESTLERVLTFNYRGDGWGLTTDGIHLIRSDGSDALHFHDPETFEFRFYKRVRDGENPVRSLNELEWVQGEIWANVWQQDQIARIDPETGMVKGWIDLTPLLPQIRFDDEQAVANGIAYDAASGRLYVTGKLWPELYEIEVPGLVPRAAEDGAGAASGTDDDTMFRR